MFYKVFAWVGIVIGSLAIWGSVADADFYALIGGGLFLGSGLIILKLTKELAK